jgi:hypothetical protein
MEEKRPLLAPGVELEPALADPKGLLRQRLGRTAIRGAIFGLLCVGLGALLAWLYLKDANRGDSPLSAHIAVFALLALFFLGGLRFLWVSATSGPRRVRLLRIVDEEPERIARIYAAVMRSRPGVHREIIRPPEAENMPPAPGGYHLVIELKEPTRLERLLGSQRHAIIARAQDIPALLAWLRAKAPNADGPPEY